MKENRRSGCRYYVHPWLTDLYLIEHNILSLGLESFWYSKCYPPLVWMGNKVSLYDIEGSDKWYVFRTFSIRPCFLSVTETNVPYIFVFSRYPLTEGSNGTKYITVGLKQPCFLEVSKMTTVQRVYQYLYSFPYEKHHIQFLLIIFFPRILMIWGRWVSTVRTGVQNPKDRENCSIPNPITYRTLL